MHHRQTLRMGLALWVIASFTSCQYLPFGKRPAAEVPLIPPMPAWAHGTNQGVAKVTLAEPPPGVVDSTIDGMQGTPSAATGGVYDFSSIIPTATSGVSSLGWQRSATEAGLESRVSGKPMLVLAAHKLSSSSQTLESTLTAHPEFSELAKEFVLLRLDYSDKEVSDSEFYKDLKKRLKVKGYPTLLVLLPDATEILRLSGYKVEYQARYLTQLRGSLKGVADAVEIRRKRLEKEEGYRLWKTPDGSGFFAKPVEIDANAIVFRTEWNETLRTFMNRLAPEDQAWIEEKRKGTKPSS